MITFINNLIPYGTDMTLYYIGIGIIIWIIGLIIIAKDNKKDTDYMFSAWLWSVICIFWFVTIIFVVVAIPVYIIWKIFGKKS